MSHDESRNGADPSGRSEFARFEALAKRLIQVPKAELDKKRGKAKKTARA